MSRNKGTSPKTFFALDLFAGPGGLSEGFAEAGFEIAAQVEKDSTACKTLRLRTIYRELRKRNDLGRYWKLVRKEMAEDEIRDEFKEIADRCDAQVVNREFGSS